MAGASHCAAHIRSLSGNIVHSRAPVPMATAELRLRMSRVMTLVFVLACTIAAGDEVFVPLARGGCLALTTRGPSAFRVRLLYDDVAGRNPCYDEDAGRRPLASLLVAPDDADAPFRQVQNGITAAFGSAVVSSSGELLLRNSAGILLTKSHPLGRDTCHGLPNMRPVGGDQRERGNSGR